MFSGLLTGRYASEGTQIRANNIYLSWDQQAEK